MSVIRVSIKRKPKPTKFSAKRKLIYFMFSESVFHPTSGKLTQSISSDLEVCSGLIPLWERPQASKLKKLVDNGTLLPFY